MISAATWWLIAETGTETDYEAVAILQGLFGTV